MEVREVADIRYISELLGGIARACTGEDAEQVAGSTVYVTKRIGDHVLWKNTLIPWRRAPFWTIARVVLQVTLKEFKIRDGDLRWGYKLFVTFVLSRVLERAVAVSGDGVVGHDVLFFMNAKIVGNKLVIEIPLNAVPVPSGTGKSLVVATSHGNKTTQAQVHGKHVVVGLNAYIPKA